MGPNKGGGASLGFINCQRLNVQIGLSILSALDACGWRQETDDGNLFENLLTGPCFVVGEKPSAASPPGSRGRASALDGQPASDYGICLFITSLQLHKHFETPQIWRRSHSLAGGRNGRGEA